jgi:hypothetical protein
MQDLFLRNVWLFCWWSYFPVVLWNLKIHFKFEILCNISQYASSCGKKSLPSYLTSSSKDHPVSCHRNRKLQLVKRHVIRELKTAYLWKCKTKNNWFISGSGSLKTSVCQKFAVSLIRCTTAIVKVKKRWGKQQLYLCSCGMLVADCLNVKKCYNITHQTRYYFLVYVFP